jgi:hypothetical protein
VLAHTSISAYVEQHQLDNLMDFYHSSQGQHIDSISLRGADMGRVTLRQLPSALTKLRRLELFMLGLQLQPGGGHLCVLGAAAAHPLKQLHLGGCNLIGGITTP